MYQRADGWYVGAVSTGVGPDGKRKRHVVYGKSKAEVREKLKALQGEIDDGIEPSSATCSEVFSKYVTLSRDIKESTRLWYQDVQRLYVDPYVGKIPINKLTPLHVEGVLESLKNAGKSIRTQQKAFTFLWSACEQAVTWRLISRSPVKGISRPTAPKREMRTWSPEQVKSFLTIAEESRLAPIFQVAAETGLRLGEVIGMQWSDLSPDYSRLALKRQFHARLLRLTDLKTRANREIVFSPALAAALKKHRARLLAEGLSASPFVFPTKTGKPYRSANVNHSFHYYQTKAGIPKELHLRFHDLRHTLGKLMMNSGVAIADVSHQLGHAQVSTTLDIYGHPSSDASAQVAAKIRSLLK